MNNHSYFKDLDKNRFLRIGMQATSYYTFESYTNPVEVGSTNYFFPTVAKTFCLFAILVPIPSSSLPT